LDDINARVKEAATNLRRERVKLIGEKIKQVNFIFNFWSLIWIRTQFVVKFNDLKRLVPLPLTPPSVSKLES